MYYQYNLIVSRVLYFFMTCTARDEQLAWARTHVLASASVTGQHAREINIVDQHSRSINRLSYMKYQTIMHTDRYNIFTKTI